MTTYQRTNSENPDFQNLVISLDAELKARDGSDNAFYAQFNKIDMIKHAIVAYQDGVAVACGAIKQFEADSMEVKRMFVPAHLRSKGLASGVLNELEIWAKELGYKKTVLETGKRQPEAIQLYLKNEYKIIPNYGQYQGIENSVCFEKIIV